MTKTINKLAAFTVAKYRHDTLMGKQYIVVPAVIIKEGVLNGSQGPILYTKDEMAASAQFWNGRPLVVYHPNSEGIFVSAAATPDVVSEYTVGMMLNTNFREGEDGKGDLITECWFELERLEAVDKRVLEAIEKSQVLNVSVGVFFDPEPSTGEFDGKSYTVIAHNYIPDHLAILPDQLGACSVADGCGLGVNAFSKIQRKMCANAIQHIEEKSTLVYNEMAYGDIAIQLESVLNETHGEKGHYWDGYVSDVFDGYCIYGLNGKLWKQSYKVNKGTISLSGSAVEVQRTVNYEPIANKLSPKESKMSKEKIIDALLASKTSGFQQEDREYLMGLSEERLAVFQEGFVAEKPAGCDCPGRQAIVNLELKKDEPKKELSVQEYLANMPLEMRDVYTEGMQARNAKREELVKTITANESNIFTEDQLRTKSTAELAGIAALARKADIANPVINWAGNAGGPPASNKKDMPEGLELPVLSFE